MPGGSPPVDVLAVPSVWAQADGPEPVGFTFTYTFGIGLPLPSVTVPLTWTPVVELRVDALLVGAGGERDRTWNC